MRSYVAMVFCVASATSTGGCVPDLSEEAGTNEQDPDVASLDSEIAISSCTTVNNVNVNVPNAAITSYWFSGNLFTTGCGSQSDIKVATSTMHGPTCAPLRVRLFPSSGGSIVPRGFLFVCPSNGFVQLANFILPGTKYRVEDDLGPSVVSVQH